MRKEIFELHNRVAKFLKQTEQLQGSTPGTIALFDISVGNEFRYALRSYLDADDIQRSESSDKGLREERILLLQVHHHLRIAHDDMIDWVEKYFRQLFYRILERYGSVAVAHHIDIKECHDIQIKMEKEIVASRENRNHRRSLYNAMSQLDGGLANQMIEQVKNWKGRSLSSWMTPDKQCGKIHGLWGSLWGSLWWLLPLRSGK